jgi:hypothetical protein
MKLAATTIRSRFFAVVPYAEMKSASWMPTAHGRRKMAKTSVKQRLSPRDPALVSATNAIASAVRRAKKGDPEDHLFARYEAAATPLERRALRSALLQIIAEKANPPKPKTFRKTKAVSPPPEPEAEPIVEEPPKPTRPAKEARTKMLDLSDAAMMLQFAGGSSDPEEDDSPEPEASEAPTPDAATGYENAFAELDSLNDLGTKDDQPAAEPPSAPEDNPFASAFAELDSLSEPEPDAPAEENSGSPYKDPFADAFAELASLPETTSEEATDEATVEPEPREGDDALTTGGKTSEEDEPSAEPPADDIVDEAPDEETTAPPPADANPFAAAFAELDSLPDPDPATDETDIAEEGTKKGA